MPVRDRWWWIKSHAMGREERGRRLRGVRTPLKEEDSMLYINLKGPPQILIWWVRYFLYRVRHKPLSWTYGLPGYVNKNKSTTGVLIKIYCWTTQVKIITYKWVCDSNKLSTITNNTFWSFYGRRFTDCLTQHYDRER